MVRNLMVSACVSVLLVPHVSGAQTNGFSLQCMSARAAARGCVTRAQADVPTSLFRDPAGLVLYKQPALEVNFAAFMPALTFQNRANPGTNEGSLHAYPLASFAYAGGRLGGRVAWAIGMEPIGGFGSDFKLRHELISSATGTAIDYESFFAAAKIGPSFAIALSDRFSVGASLSAAYAQIRDFRMPFSMSPAMARGLAGIPQLDPMVYGPLFQQFKELAAYGDSRSYDGYTWAADLGISYHRANGFRLSATWSPERPITLDGGSASIDMSAQFGQMMQAMTMARAQAYGESQAEAQGKVVQQLTAAGVDLQRGVTGNYAAAAILTLPMTLGAAASFPLGRVAASAEIEWRQWSNAEDVMPFNLSDGDNPNINLMLNGDPANGSFNFPFPLHWKNTLSGKVGANYDVSDRTVLRAGFMVGSNPVPDNTVFITFPAISTKAAGIGATVTIGRFPLDVSFVHAFEEEVNSDPSGHAIGSEYVASRTTMLQNVITIGTVWRF